jgi:hypothetical protein
VDRKGKCARRLQDSLFLIEGGPPLGGMSASACASNIERSAFPVHCVHLRTRQKRAERA